jgi:hypothetical protein
MAGLVAAAGIAAAGYWALARRRESPEEKEKRRRLAVNVSRRTIEGEIVEADASAVHYIYEFRGVEYHASQDVRALPEALPENPARLIGPVTVKFDPANPANSIVVCEEWSGLPQLRRGAAEGRRETE